jgi:2-polyprenyl-6-hydroxyphenyl methylase/3-demethylubiquinone-9 3-methyltransferase
MKETASISGYYFSSTESSHAHAYLLPTVERLIQSCNLRDQKVFDLGCGNGSIARWLGDCGFDVSGVDPSESGIEHAKRICPEQNLQLGSCYDPLSEQFGQFPLVISLEVVEHVYAPRDYARCLLSLMEPNGWAIVSTPYHGYLKNLLLALTNHLDGHFTALWDHGHIKFWSIKTLSRLFEETGLVVSRVERVGRIPALAKSMVFLIRKT